VGYVTFSQVLGQQCFDRGQDESFRPTPEELASLVVCVLYDTALIDHEECFWQQLEQLKA
jgi:hypothetical protein